MRIPRWAAILLIIIGAGLIAHPLFIMTSVRYEQRKQKANFYHQYRSVEVEIEPVAPTIFQYESWPETLLEIPALSLEVFVVEVEDLEIFKTRANFPPGHYPGTAFPGEKGNVAIAGHRTGPANYFRYLDRLKEGDEIILHTPEVSFTYIVERVHVVSKYDWSVVDTTDYPALTLTTCQAVGSDSNAKRLIVRARLENAL